MRRICCSQHEAGYVTRQVKTLLDESGIRDVSILNFTIIYIYSTNTLNGIVYVGDQ